jgi:hypothetical protein
VTEQVIERLDRLISIVSLAFADEIERARERVRANPISVGLLDQASDWTAAGELQRVVAKQTGMSPRSVRSKLSELVALGALEVRGGGPTTAYKTTGLI